MKAILYIALGGALGSVSLSVAAVIFGLSVGRYLSASVP